MISDKALIAKAKSAVKPRKSAAGKLICDVGAALVTNKGNVFVGSCFDSNEGSSLCAEKAAMAAMITAGESRIEKIVAVWTNGTIIPPCGSCREWMWQIDGKNWYAMIIVAKNKSISLKNLLPYHWHNPDSGK